MLDNPLDGLLKRFSVFRRPSGGSWSGIGTTVLTCNLPAGRRYSRWRFCPTRPLLRPIRSLHFISEQHSGQVQLHFAEIVFTSARQRAFNIVINGATVLNNFDIIANTGAANKTIEENFAAIANSNGQIVIQFTAGSAGRPLINGIKVQ